MLPGKLCIGILEEDNPLKAYFRLKPLLVENDGRYELYDGAEVYPEDGCIRIVPDKNESSHFKARMRRMGRYCVLDLREHAGENDKIRPNKNYRGDDTERNAHIVYSDVVREPAENMIFEIAAELQPGEWSGAAPGTPRLLRADSLETWAYTPPAEDGGTGSVALDGETLVEEELQRFEIPGFPGETLRFAIRLPGTLPSVIGAPKLRPERPMPSPQPMAASQPTIQTTAPQAEPQAQPAPVADKPWISRELPIAPPVRGRITNLRQSLEAQSGLNPRRSRSLQDIIEEKWRHSRVDQLGHPVPANATGQPVESPLDKALDALRDAWQLPELRKRLLTSISEMDEFSDALTDLVRRERDGALRRDLEELEAERLKSLDEVDKLRREKQELRETFKREIREEEEAAFRDAVERTRAAQEECERQETAAREARKAASSAEDFLAALNDGRFEDKLKDFAFTSRAVELLTHPKEAPAPREEISDETPTAAEWIERTRRAFAVEGLEIDAMHAANLLICVALSDSLLLSGSAAPRPLHGALRKDGRSRTEASLRAAPGGARARREQPPARGDRPRAVRLRSEFAGDCHAERQRFRLSGVRGGTGARFLRADAARPRPYALAARRSDQRGLFSGAHGRAAGGLPGRQRGAARWTRAQAAKAARRAGAGRRAAVPLDVESDVALLRGGHQAQQDFRGRGAGSGLRAKGAALHPG